jgi:asparagine synthase (glutamine-hydrolysing)
MCGIVGSLNLAGEPVSPVVVRAMADALAHRGPDGHGSFCEGAVGLGHRRLAVIDPSPAGHQPMATADGRYVIAYNGEVYNFAELRAELEAKRWQFRSGTDTEVVLAAVAEWGLSALHRFNGMFAFALWDRQERELVLARDRYGIKPLYLAVAGTSLLFGSEIKALLASGRVQARMDVEGLVEYFTFQNFLTDRTLFDGVRLLPAGSFIRVREGAAVLAEPASFWDFRFADDPVTGDAEEQIEELDRLFRQAVNRQLVSDVPLGSYLSGGIDSGSITAVAAGQLPHMRSFTVGFDLHSASGLEIGFDERAKAEHMSYLFGTEHYEMVLKAGDLERSMAQLVWHLEEPRVGQSYPNFYAAQLASKFITVVLAGTGGDELFAGYPWRYYRASAGMNVDQFAEDYFESWQRLVPADAAPCLFKPLGSSAKAVSPRDLFGSVLQGQPSALQGAEDFINQSLYFEAKTFLHGLLVVEDKLSMAHGLETRVPFLDNDLVDFALRLPVQRKLGNLSAVERINENDPGPKSQRFFERTHDGKLILRRVMGRYVPGDVTEGKKQGFSAPDASWFRGESIDYVRRLLFDGSPRIYEYLDRDTVTALVSDHLEGRANRRLLIWSLVFVEQWCRTFLS